MAENPLIDKCFVSLKNFNSLSKQTEYSRQPALKSLKELRRGQLFLENVYTPLGHKRNI